MSFSNETEVILDKIKVEIYLILQLSKSCIAAQAFETRFPKNMFLKKTSIVALRLRHHIVKS